MSQVRTKYAFPRRNSLINFFIIRPTRRTKFANLFLEWNSTCFGQCLCPSSGVHSLYTQQWYMSNKFVSGWNWFLLCCHQQQSKNQFHCDPVRKLSTNLYEIYHCWVYSEWTRDDGQRHCPKHVEFHAKNKFANLVHFVGLILKKFVMMHGHMNVKFFNKIYYVCFQTILLCSVFVPYFRNTTSPIQFSPLTNSEHNTYSTQPSLNYCIWCKNFRIKIFMLLKFWPNQIWSHWIKKRQCNSYHESSSERPCW